MQVAVPAAAALTLASGTVFISQGGIGAISAIENVIGCQGIGVLTGYGDDNVLIVTPGGGKERTLLSCIIVAGHLQGTIRETTAAPASLEVTAATELLMTPKL